MVGGYEGDNDFSCSGKGRRQLCPKPRSREMNLLVCLLAFFFLFVQSRMCTYLMLLLMFNLNLCHQLNLSGNTFAVMPRGRSPG